MSAVRRSRATSLPPPEVDGLLLTLLFALVGTGFVVVASASMELAEIRYGDRWHHVVRHALYLLVALLGGAFVLSIPTRLWRALALPGYVLVVLLLGAVLLPGIGREVNGAQRWFAVGPVSFQPSVAAKVLLLFWLAAHLDRHADALRGAFLPAARPLAMLLLPAVLLLAEPDLGTTVVLFGAAAGLLLLAGARLRDLTVLGALASLALGALILTQPYRMERMRAFLDPWAVQYDGGYQLTQALIAFGRGEWFGVGLGEGLQKLFYLPEAHTDFIYAVVAEELGAVAALLLALAFALLVLRGLTHGRIAELRGDRFAAFLAYGASLLLGVQALVSLGVNTGVLPTKGLTLPLVSYGGNALIASCALVAVVLRVAWENAVAGAAPRRLAA